MECCTFLARGGVRLCCGEGPLCPVQARDIARARSVHLRTACVRPCRPPWLRTSLLVPLPGPRHQELVAPAPTCKCRRSGGERGRAKSIGVDRWASRTRRIAPADVEGWISLSGQRGVSCGCGTARKHASVCAILEAGQCGRVRDVVAAATSRACAQRRSRVAPGRRVPARGARTSAHPPGGQRRELAQKGDFLRAVRVHTTTSPSAGHPCLAAADRYW